MSEAPDTPSRGHVEPLLREMTGRVLRRHRHDVGERLVETARRAGVSAQYLSELERGRKDASSEVLAAVAGALDMTLLDLTTEVVVELSATQIRHAGRVHSSTPVVPLAPRGPVAVAA